MIFFNKQSKVKLIKQENGRKPAHPEKKSSPCYWQQWINGASYNTFLIALKKKTKKMQ